PVVGTAPTVAAIAADHSGREAGFNRHDGEDDRQDLAGSAVVERRAEARVDAEPPGHQLMMGIDVVGAPHHDAIYVLVTEASLVERVLDRVLQEAQRVRPDLAEAALAGTDDRVFVPQRIHADLPIPCPPEAAGASGAEEPRRGAPASRGRSSQESGPSRPARP